MGGNIQKGKSQLESGKKGENYPQLFSAKEKEYMIFMEEFSIMIM